MYPDTPSVSQLSHVISQAAAPAFLLGALAAFIAVLISRLNRIVDRTIVLNGISDDDAARCRLNPSSRIRVFFGIRLVTNQIVRSKGLHYRVGAY